MTTIMSNATTRQTILELCSESEYGSWEFWSNKDNKTEAECKHIVHVIAALVKERMLYPVEYSSVTDQSYKEVVLDITRLQNEVERSRTNDIDPDKFYWFLATDEGKKEDRLLRSS